MLRCRDRQNHMPPPSHLPARRTAPPQRARRSQRTELPQAQLRRLQAGLSFNTTLHLFPANLLCQGASLPHVSFNVSTFAAAAGIIRLPFNLIDEPIAGFHSKSKVAVTVPQTVVSSSTGAEGNSTAGGDDTKDVAQLAHIALATSAALLFVAAIVACALRKQGSADSSIKDQPTHGSYNSMA